MSHADFKTAGLAPSNADRTFAFSILYGLEKDLSFFIISFRLSIISQALIVLTSFGDRAITAHSIDFLVFLFP